MSWMDKMARYGSEKSLHSLQSMHPGQSTRPVVAVAVAVADATTSTSLTPTMTTCTITSPNKVTAATSPIHVPSIGSPGTPSKLISNSAWLICLDNQLTINVREREREIIGMCIG